MPWLDPAGRFSPFKLAVFLLLFVPGILIAVDFAHGTLGPRPLNQALHQIGNWSLKLILLSLAVSPARRIFRWARVMQVRRMVGVAAFFYAAIHLVLYIADEAFDLRKVGLEILLRIYLTIGFAALLILTAMAVTSTDRMIRRLGGRRWHRLHQFVYLAALLSVVHFFMQVKAAVDEPWIMAGLFFWLMSWRLLDWRGQAEGRIGRWSPAFLAPAAALVTGLGEALYYHLKLGAPILQVLRANLELDLDLGMRPAQVVLAICLGIAAVSAVRQLTAKRKPRRRETPIGAGSMPRA